MLPAGTNVTLDEVADTDAVQESALSTSVIVKLTTREILSEVICAVTAEITGASFIGLTVKLNELVACRFGAPLSETVATKLVVPN